MTYHVPFYIIKLLIEFIFSIVIVGLCIFIFIKTREIYYLTKHKGIEFFRKSFLYFGISYFSVFLLNLFAISMFANNIRIPRYILMPISLILVGYFSTIAIFYLIYSEFWKKFDNKNLIIIANFIALLIVLVSVLTRSPYFIGLVQLPLISFLIILKSKKQKKSKKKNHTSILYFLICGFWIINLIVQHSRRLMPLEIKVFLQIISIGIFVYLAYRVTKWTK